MTELLIISRLLEYPDAALWQHQQELFDALAETQHLSLQNAHHLGVFIRDLLQDDLLDAQAPTANCSTAAAPPRCCCSNMCMANRAIAARRWWICWRSMSARG